MSQNLTISRNELLSAMDEGKPLAVYQKTILGQVAVTVWDNFLQKPIDVILKGDPRRKDVGCIVSVYSTGENAFFKRANLKHLKKGTIREIPVQETPVEVPTIAQASDEELTKVVNSKYMALLAELNKINSIPVLFRMITIAEELDKSEKITGAIQKRISELQSAEYPTQMEVELNANKEED